MNAPERIWIKGNTIDYDLTRWSISRWNGDTEYIRADMVPQWQPIETAPKDGTEILGAWPPFPKRNEWTIQPVFFYHGNWIHGWDEDEDLALHPTHWMPLPEPPHPTARHST